MPKCGDKILLPIGRKLTLTITHARFCGENVMAEALVAMGNGRCRYRETNQRLQLEHGISGSKALLGGGTSVCRAESVHMAFYYKLSSNQGCHFGLG